MNKNQPTAFRFIVNKNDEVTIFHHERIAANLRGPKAIKFLDQAVKASDEELQHRMARLTGNYKRGNER